MKKKRVYPRVCHNHPKRTENLFYVFNRLENNRSGQLLCEECKLDDKSYQEQRATMDTREGSMHSVQETEERGDTSPEI